uniref:LOW QUALITY PROTEIN: transmembrane protein 220-like n=1 Tax=Styela clava TaxID=7725 RepID=UPI00193AAB4A|nr:LOW QUALITY PROTEIN: transmembrane protein 220-like [Styela clava]
MLALVIFRILNFIAAIFFILSAFVQYNDPDPELWIPVYLAPAIISGLIGFKPSLSESKLIKVFDFEHIFSLQLLSAYLLHQNYQNNFIHWVVHDEVGREFGGLVIVIFWIIFMHETSHLSVKNWLSSVFIWIPIAMWIYVYNNQEYCELWPQHCQTALYPESYPPGEEG